MQAGQDWGIGASVLVLVQMLSLQCRAQASCRDAVQRDAPEDPRILMEVGRIAETSNKQVSAWQHMRAHKDVQTCKLNQL